MMTKGDELELPELLKSMQCAVNFAQESLAENHLRHLKQYFEEDGKAKTEVFQIGDGRIIQVPLVTLINQNALRIEELEMEFKVRVSSVESLPLQNPVDSLDYPKIKVRIGRMGMRSNLIKVKMKLGTTEIPEGMARMVDEFEKQVCPITKNNEEQ